MKKILLVFVFLFVSVVAQAEPANITLTQLLQNTRTIQADFTQSLLNKAAKSIQQSQGTMYLQRPGKFRWQVNKPTDQVIIANGHKLWVYDKDLDQVIIRSLKSGAGETPALLLSDDHLILENDFDITMMQTDRSDSQLFSLMPKDKNSLFSSLKIVFINQKINEMRLQDHLGQTTVIKFKNIKTNVGLSDSLFQFTPPPHVDVIDETQKQRTRH